MDKAAIVVGAGQTPGHAIGNGRATAILFAREGARVLLVDRDLASADETRVLIEREGGTASTFRADVTVDSQCKAVVDACVERFGRIDVLHNNVGIGAGDQSITEVSEEAFVRILNVNLKGPFSMCRHAIPVMRAQKSGVITNISSIAAVAATTTLTAYRASKAALNALTQNIAIDNAAYGIRANAIMPGLIDTPMAIEGNAKRLNIDKQELIEQRGKRVPMGHMGSAWDVAYAALFLASDEAKFITGVLLPVDGGQSCRVG